MNISDIREYARKNHIDEVIEFLARSDNDIESLGFSGMELYRKGEEDCNKLYICPLDKGIDEAEIPQVLKERVLFARDTEEAYRALWLLERCANAINVAWYENIIKIDLEFSDITLKRPSLNNLINYFGNIVKNPVIIYDENFNVLEKTAGWLTGYERDEKSLRKFRLGNLIYYRQTVSFMCGGGCAHS